MPCRNEATTKALEMQGDGVLNLGELLDEGS
jgi:hypothetical protein